MERNYEAERIAREITGAYRAAGFQGFRCEYDERTDSYWIQPSANGAILVSGKTPVEAAAAFLKAAGALFGIASSHAAAEKALAAMKSKRESIR